MYNCFFIFFFHDIPPQKYGTLVRFLLTYHVFRILSILFFTNFFFIFLCKALFLNKSKALFLLVSLQNKCFFHYFIFISHIVTFCVCYFENSYSHTFWLQKNVFSLIQIKKGSHSLSKPSKSLNYSLCFCYFAFFNFYSLNVLLSNLFLLISCLFFCLCLKHRGR